MLETKGMTQVERRTNQRLQIEIPVHIQWRTSKGLFEEDSLTVNVSTHGAYFKIEQEVKPDQVIELSMGVPNKFYGLLPSAMLRARGRIVRLVAEQHTAGSHGVAVYFEAPPQLDFELPHS